MVEERSFGYASGYLVTNGNKKGYLNKQGKVLIPAIYDAIEIGSSYFTVTDSGRKGVLDEENELVVPIIFDELSQIKMAPSASCLWRLRQVQLWKKPQYGEAHRG